MAARKKKPGTEVAKRKTTALASAELLNRMAAESGAGLEGATQEDMAMPFLAIAQEGSPQVKPKEPAYIEGIQAGDLFDTATTEFWSPEKDLAIGEHWPRGKGLEVVLCLYDKCFVEWVPRNQGGGFVQRHDRMADIVRSTPPDEKGVRKLKNGNELQETAYWYSVLVDPLGENHKPIVIAMKATGLSPSRKLVTRMDAQQIEVDGAKVKAPLYAFKCRVTTVFESRSGGNSYNWVVEPQGMVQDADLYALCSDFSKKGVSFQQGQNTEA